MSALALTRESNVLPSKADWSVMLEMADALVKSGMLPGHIKTAQAAVAIIQKGRELGIPPMHALSNIVTIQGKPTANAELMLALVYRDHGDNAIRFAESTPQRCRVQYKRRAWAEYLEFAFTMDDARTAGLTSSQTWQKYPAAMLRARCVSAVARMAFPDSIGGMYTPEELGANVEVSHEGEVFVTGTLELPARTALEVLNTDPHDYVDAEAVELDDSPPAPESLLATLSYERERATWTKADLAAYLNEKHGWMRDQSITTMQAQQAIAHLQSQQPSPH